MLNTNIGERGKYVSIVTILTDKVTWNKNDNLYNKYAIVVLLTNGMRMIQEFPASMIDSDVDLSIPLSMYNGDNYNVFVNAKITNNTLVYSVGNIKGYAIDKVGFYGVK